MKEPARPEEATRKSEPGSLALAARARDGGRRRGQTPGDQRDDPDSSGGGRPPAPGEWRFAPLSIVHRRLVARSKLDSRVADIPLPPRRVLLQAPFEQARQVRWCRRRKRGPVRLVGQDCRDRVRDIVARANAGRPVSTSYSTQPNAQMSVRLSTACPRACSGLM